MARDRVVTRAELPEDHVEPPEAAGVSPLRPQSLEEYVGQPELVEKLGIGIAAARARHEAMEHVLLHGPPGLGKTTLAYIIANQLQSAPPRITSGPALNRPTDLVSLLTNVQPRDVVFIDEIHRMPTAVEEYLYSAMEDFVVDVVTGSGTHADSIRINIHPFTLIGATTRSGLLSGPMRARFGIVHHLNFYSQPDLLTILQRSAALLTMHVEPGALEMVARRSRGTPRVANRLLRRVRDFALIRGGGRLTSELAAGALELEGIDDKGLDALDRRFMSILARDYDGGPAGLDSLAANMGEESDVLEDVIEPFLLQSGLLRRTSKGRQLTASGWAHIKLKPPDGAATDELFEP